MRDVNQPERNSRFTWYHALFALIPVALIGSLMFPIYGRTCAKGNITKGISNCRQIVTALRIYSGDYGGNYPDAALTDPQSSNEVFRVLFRENVIDNEMIFGCPVSHFVPDGNTGSAPEFEKAVEAGENHWAMTAGLSGKSPGNIPVVYENPVVVTWSPKWNLDAKGTSTRGRAWPNGVIIGMNDGSVSLQPLGAKKGTAVPLKDVADGLDLFNQHQPPDPSQEWKILDVQVHP